MDNKNETPVTIIPEKSGTVIILVLSLFAGIAWWIYINHGQEKNIFKVPDYSQNILIFVVCLSCFFCFYFFCYFIFSKIIIYPDKIILPYTDDNGVPSGIFLWSKRTIDIKSITKIIKYSSVGGYRGMRMGTQGAKLSIICKGHINAALDYKLYGDYAMEELIEEIVARNEEVEIIDYGRSIL